MRFPLQPHVLTIGEILVEIMATSRGNGFREAMDLVGPFPSGAPAIFIDQIARLGLSCAMIGCVGDDDFGWLNIERLRRDGVDVSAIEVRGGAATGSAFVRYRNDGGRDFVFNLRDSANRHIRVGEAARAAIERASHLHVVGSSLASEPVATAVLEALGTVKARGGTVSFDPNIRKEMLGAPGLQDSLRQVLAATDLFLPSGDELLLFSSRTEETPALRDLLARGISAIVHKKGAAGARYLDGQSDIVRPAHRVEEVDPTGAGDIFGATFVAGWLNRLAPEDSLRLACAAGALAVMRQGPMEGVASRDEIEAFLESSGSP